AFEAYAKAMPNNCIFLVDTYDTIEGVKKAISIGQQLSTQGHEMAGIRLDSGNLRDLSIEARRLLDSAGFSEAAIVASNDLDEHTIHRLKASGARINVWGVGTKLATAYDQPALGGVYKLAALQSEKGEWEYKIKLSNDAVKVSNPGIQQVFRFVKDGEMIGDLILHEPWGSEDNKISSFYGASVSTEGAEKTPLLEKIFHRGRRLYNLPSLDQSRARAISQLELLPERYRRLIGAASYPVGLDSRLSEEKQRLVKAHKNM
ncbi:MAG: nicotinate phosphoribosyltransferase, partial [Bacteroidota bacterium]